MKAKKHPGGRPRTTSPPKEDLIKLGQEMVDWVERNDPIHLSQWYTLEKLLTYRQWKAIIQHEEFLPYYEKALKIIGIKYIDGTIHPSIAQRWQRIYFSDLKEEEDESLKFREEVKANSNSQAIESLSDIIKQAASGEIKQE